MLTAIEMDLIQYLKIDLLVFQKNDVAIRDPFY